MSKRIEKAFENKVFIPQIIAGDPDIETSKKVIMAAIEAGAGLVEIGIPFSDPVAQSPALQKANLRALEANMTVEKAFELVQNLRTKTDVPIVFTSYLNPVFRYGYENFFKKCAKVGVDGIIIPDLPYEERDEVAPYARKYDVAQIPMIAPASENRIEKIAKAAGGFIYSLTPLEIEAIRKATNLPVVVGFEKINAEEARQILPLADGIISVLDVEEIIEQYEKSAPEKVFKKVKSVLDIMR